MKEKIIQNWKSGLTVSIVSIPLSLALAISSGATPTQGIITAFWAGLMGGIFASSNFNIIGPTGALAGILIGFTFKYGYQYLPLVSILSGILIFVAYLFNFDKYIIFIPQSVVHGFTLGVAFIIGFGQLDTILGIVGLEKKETFILNIVNILQHIDQMNWLVFLSFLLSTSVIMIWNKYVIQKIRIPGATVVAFIGIVSMMIIKEFNLPLNITTLGDKYPTLRAKLFENSFQQFDFKILFNRDIVIISVAVSVIAILETLISGHIASMMTKTEFDRKKEVFGLSIANLASGIFGGIPATAALARTALNIKSGANHRTSAVINAFFVGLISIFFLEYFKYLPMFVIAAILFVVAIGMVETKHFIKLVENERTAFAISLFVAVLVIVEDPIVGLIIGSIIALINFIYRISYGQTEIEIWKDGVVKMAVLRDEFLKLDEIDSDAIVYKISGALSYINMPAHLETIKKIKNNKYVIISLRAAFYIDVDGIEYLGQIIENLKRNNNEHIILVGINKAIEKKIKNEEFYKRKLLDNKIYERTSIAIKELLAKDNKNLTKK
jgi:SulP family sulfate permease